MPISLYFLFLDMTIVYLLNLLYTVTVLFSVSSSLKLPNKLIRLVNTNHSLKEKLSTATSTNRPSTAHPAQQFVERLCAEVRIL